MVSKINKIHMLQNIRYEHIITEKEYVRLSKRILKEHLGIKQEVV